MSEPGSVAHVAWRARTHHDRSDPGVRHAHERRGGPSRTVTRRALTATAAARLADEWFEACPTEPLADEVRAWLGASRRFRSFADANRDKIRKKLRGATDFEPRRDVRAELRVASLLVADARIGLAFESYGSGRRGPDFTISFREHPAFNLEVTRLQGEPDEAAIGHAIVTKLRQLPPSAANVVLLAFDGSGATVDDIGATVRTLRTRADRRDDEFFRAHGLEGFRAFHDRFPRLGAVIAWCDRAGDPPQRASAWTNSSARMAVRPEALRAAVACLSPDPEAG